MGSCGIEIAHLDIRSEAGKAIVSLTAEVDVHPHRVQSRNGPSRQRRSEKRATAREAAVAEEVVQTVVEERKDETKNETVGKDTIAANARVVLDEESKPKEAGKARATGNKPTEKVNDEVCPNEVYNKAKSNSFTSGSTATPSTSRKPAFDYYTLPYDDDLSYPD